MRLDNYLVINNYFQTRNKAQIAIKSNRVLVNNIVINKSGYEVKNNDSIEIKQIDYEFVSRGGYKLLKAGNGKIYPFALANSAGKGSER